MRFSVVIPTYNGMSTIEQTISSVLAQSYRDFEVVVVNDASTDGTKRFLEEWAAREARLTVVSVQENQGAPWCRNKGVELSSGELLAFNDDDTLWEKDKLQRFHELFLRRPAMDMAFSGAITTDLEGVRREVLMPDPKDKAFDQHLLSIGGIGTPSLVFQREFFERLGGFDESLPRLQDWDLWLRAFKRGNVGRIPELLVHTQLDQGGISSETSSYVRALEIFNKKLKEERYLERQEEALLWFGRGNVALFEGNGSLGRRYMWRAWRCRPGSGRYGLAAMLSLPGATFYQRLMRVLGRVGEEDK